MLVYQKGISCDLEFLPLSFRSLQIGTDVFLGKKSYASLLVLEKRFGNTRVTRESHVSNEKTSTTPKATAKGD